MPGPRRSKSGLHFTMPLADWHCLFLSPDSATPPVLELSTKIREKIAQESVYAKHLIKLIIDGTVQCLSIKFAKFL